MDCSERPDADSQETRHRPVDDSAVSAAGKGDKTTMTSANTWIAFFRGVNVGGKNLLPMAKLKNDLTSLKLKRVHTYIQSGNAVFEAPRTSAPALSNRIARCIEQRHGFRPHVLVLSRADLQRAVQLNPFPDAVAQPTTLHFFFLAEPAANPNRRAMEAARSPTETYWLSDAVFYLHAPDGIGRSKLAAGVEKYLGVVATARNYRTVEAVRAISDGVS